MANEALLLDVEHEFGIDPFNNFNVAVCSRSPSCRSAFINAIFRRYQNAVDLEKKQGVYGCIIKQTAHMADEAFSAALEKAKHELGMDYLNHFNVAVCSKSRSCRSIFIKSILHRFQHADIRTEQTTDGMIVYKDWNRPFVSIWDVPHDNIGKADYIINYRLYALDCILIVSDHRYHEVHALLARQARCWRKPFAVIRIHGDDLVQQIALTSNVNMELSAMRVRAVVENSWPHPVFIISCPAIKFGELSPYQSYFNSQTDDSLSEMDESRLIQFLDALEEAKYSVLTTSQETTNEPSQSWFWPTFLIGATLLLATASIDIPIWYPPFYIQLTMI